MWFKMEKRYAIGIDYGTESGRVIVVDVHNGQELAHHVTAYTHGVIDERLPLGDVKLEPEWALQHPDDYLEVLQISVPAAVHLAGVDPAAVIGIGISFTSCTVLAVDEQFTPLCLLEPYHYEPHAYVKLWKHHAAQREADQINALAEKRNEPFLKRYGGKVSSEWMTAKALQVLHEAPHIYEAAAYFIEAADWVTYKLTGEGKRNSGSAGYKALWNKHDGYPSSDFHAELDHRFAHFVSTKLRGEVVALGSQAGVLTSEAAAMMRLLPETAVAPGIIDAHAALLGVGAVYSGQMVMSMGTSLCHLLLSEKEVHVEGICGVVGDGIVPGLYAYEAGQAAVGDIFAWFVERALPAYVEQEAEREGITIHEWLEKRAARFQVGQSGLLALDWWNGNRSILDNASLSGMIIGLTLQSKPEEIYRALLEATAFGTRKVIETFRRSGVEVKEIIATGGMPFKNKLLMQIYADVLNQEIKIAASSQAAGIGAAIFGAVAADSARGGYDNVAEAASYMTQDCTDIYIPNPTNTAVYDALYNEYCHLHDLFGRGGNEVMLRLREIKRSQEQELLSRSSMSYDSDAAGYLTL